MSCRLQPLLPRILLPLLVRIAGDSCSTCPALPSCQLGFFGKISEEKPGKDLLAAITMPGPATWHLRSLENLDAAGPHVMEVSVKGAHLTYPLTTMRSFCHDLVETYSHYVYPPWVDPYPQVRQLPFSNEALPKLDASTQHLCLGLRRYCDPWKADPVC